MSDKIEQLKQWYEQEQIRIKQEFDSKLKELEKKELEPLIRLVKEGNTYWVIGDTALFLATEGTHSKNFERLDVFNYFTREEEAQKVQARELLARKVFLARSLARKDGKYDNNEWLPDWSNSEQTKYCIDYDTGENAVYIIPFYTSIRELSFKEKEQANIFRKYISDEEIRKFLEG